MLPAAAKNESLIIRFPIFDFVSFSIVNKINDRKWQIILPPSALHRKKAVCVPSCTTDIENKEFIPWKGFT